MKDNLQRRKDQVQQELEEATKRGWVLYVNNERIDPLTIDTWLAAMPVPGSYNIRWRYEAADFSEK